MKNKTKLVLMATGLSCAVLGCLGSATYAWFTTKNNVGVNHTNLTVSTTNPNLTVDMKRIVPSANGSVALSGVQEIDDSITFSDLSSQYGETFYEKGATEGTYAVVSAQRLDNRVLQYGLKVSNLPLANSLALVFTTAVTCPNNSESRSLKNWVRTGIYECTGDTYGTKKEDGFAMAYMNAKNTENANKYVNGETEESIATFEDRHLKNYGTSVIVEQTVRAASTRFFKISVWMEGTAASSQDDAAGGVVSISTVFSLENY